MISGPVRAGRRTVVGGYHLTPFRKDAYAYRWGCFGIPAERSLCGLTSPPPAAAPRKG